MLRVFLSAVIQGPCRKQTLSHISPFPPPSKVQVVVLGSWHSSYAFHFCPGPWHCSVVKGSLSSPSLHAVAPISPTLCPKVLAGVASPSPAFRDWESSEPTCPPTDPIGLQKEEQNFTSDLLFWCKFLLQFLPLLLPLPFVFLIAWEAIF